nr:hypothetical protein [Tanacetum cinerariifolium]
MKKVPNKVLRYFSIIPRLQRLYKSSHTAKKMIWHATGKCTEPGKMQHPVDGRAWKNFDTKYLDFAKEPRNVRLGLAADGFNLFGNLSQAYSMWLVILTTYNLPPWLCMKESSFMRMLLIPGPKSPGKDIDVYLRPLIEDLKIRQHYVDNEKDPEVSITNELFALACGPTWTPISINSYVVDGERYVMHRHDERRITQNSGICSPGPDEEMYYGCKVKRLVLRNNMTQIDTRAESFKDDQYILVTQVKQVFYLEDKAKPYWRVVEHVNHKNFSDGGVIVGEDDPDIIHFDNSSYLLLFTSLNDLDNATLHIDGQSIDVDVPPDIIDVVDEDDDITDDEDAFLMI